MSFVRPEVARTLTRWREVLIALALALFGLWLAGLGGWLMMSLGGITLAIALPLAFLGWRRMRFRMEIDAPGVVEIDEGRISYMGPVIGGAIGLSELMEVEILDVAGRRRCWRLTQSDGQALLVPLAAAGAEQLYDVLAALPGMDGHALVSAVQAPIPEPRRIWRRAPAHDRFVT